MTLSNSYIGSNNSSDMVQLHFLNSTGDRGNIKQQRYSTLAFLKIDMQHQDHQGPPLSFLSLTFPASALFWCQWWVTGDSVSSVTRYGRREDTGSKGGSIYSGRDTQDCSVI